MLKCVRMAGETRTTEWRQGKTGKLRIVHHRRRRDGAFALPALGAFALDFLPQFTHDRGLRALSLVGALWMAAFSVWCLVLRLLA
jgi:hypothetical protein